MPYAPKHTKKFILEVRAKIEAAVYRPVAALEATAWRSKEPLPFSKRTTGRKLAVKPGVKWGGLFDCAWFRFRGRVPKDAKGAHVVLLIDVNGEACVFDAKGVPRQGLTTVNAEYDTLLGKSGKRVVEVARRAKGGEAIDLWADAGCNDLFGRLVDQGKFREADIALCDDEMYALHWDFVTLHELSLHVPEDRARHHQVVDALYRAACLMSRYDSGEARAARAVLAPELAKRNGDASFSLSAIGHAHMDLGWLWPIRETRRKVARTFSTVLRLMEQYPDYRFGASQPQQFAWLKEDHPALYAQVAKRIAEGRWEVQGGMWVEADTNVTGGEALVRQFLYGKRFFREEFGIDVRTLWMPDVFGYSAALPQILQKVGCPWFMTTKISWNEHNEFPHQTFWWQGLDGSKVLAHMPPLGTYNAPTTAWGLAESEKRFHDKGVSDRGLLVFGIGDGGGGPGINHLEPLARSANLAGLPPVVQEPSEAFFKRIARHGDRYQSWVGELYLEKHQGTYTTQARNKRFNRKLENALRELEMVAAVAELLGGPKYPVEPLDRLWKELLLYQFHDILPGSSITRVYEESLARYQLMADEVAALTATARIAIAWRIDTDGMEQPVVVFNPTSWQRTEWLKFGKAWRLVTVPESGYAVVETAVAVAVPAPIAADGVLENDVVRARFAADGSLVSLFDKDLDREMLAAPSNRLEVWDDTNDAWDFRFGYRDRAPQRMKLVESSTRVDGPRALLRQVYEFQGSRLVQNIVLTNGSRRLDFTADAEWKDAHTMLRAAFAPAIHADEISCEIQFGHLKRPTHRNTGWDFARLEICAHKFVDVAQADCGLALLNDGKYGFHARGSELDICLLRTPSWPDPVADRAAHRFAYALYPHAGGLQQGGVVRAGYEFNQPLSAVSAEAGPRRRAPLPAAQSFLAVDADNVVIEAVKRAEDSDDLIVRLYEAHGSDASAQVRCFLPIAQASLVDLMEEHPRRLPMADGAVALAFKPFEIHTVRLRLKSPRRR